MFTSFSSVGYTEYLQLLVGKSETKGYNKRSLGFEFTVILFFELGNNIFVKRLNPNIGSERLVNLMTAWSHEIKELMGGMGINSIEALRGNRLMLRGIGLTDKELEILGISHAGE